MVVLVVIAVAMIALGVLLLKGKADRFIAGYNTASKHQAVAFGGGLMPLGNNGSLRFGSS